MIGGYQAGVGVIRDQEQLSVSVRQRMIAMKTEFWREQKEVSQPEALAVCA